MPELPSQVLRSHGALPGMWLRLCYTVTLGVWLRLLLFRCYFAVISPLFCRYFAVILW